MAEIVVVARATAQQGREAEMQSALHANAEASRKEEGCVAYSVLRAIDDPASFMTIERWRSQADVAAHMASPHVQTLLQTIGPMLAGPPEITQFQEL